MPMIVRITDAEYYEAQWRASAVEAAQLRLALVEAARAEFQATVLRTRGLPIDGDYELQRETRPAPTARAVSPDGVREAVMGDSSTCGQ